MKIARHRDCSFTCVGRIWSSPNKKDGPVFLRMRPS
jgi:hypothetical protein